MVVFWHFFAQTRRHFFEEGMREVAGGESVKDALASATGGATESRLNYAGGFFLLQVGHEIAKRPFGVDGGIVDDHVVIRHREKDGVSGGGRG